MRKLLLSITLGLITTAAVQAQGMRYFQFDTQCGHGKWQDTSFVVATNNQSLISDVQMELAKPLDSRKLINGVIAPGDGGFNHNTDHWFKWHIKENEWSLAEFAIEVCDGCPYSDIDGDTAYWLNTVRQYCPWSSKPVAEVSKPTAVEDVKAEMELVVYPNPANKILNIKWQGKGTINLYMLNTVGVVVRTATMYQTLPRLDISDLPDGIYFLKIKDGNRSVSRTIEVKK
ncbi:MAG: T9SS type A sorting domain-containing protein [Sphingobacteriales bacterium]|nr:MAG: T9SS type A sorting domain-containing protein [Sphingobacteriales bacterium]